MLTYLIVNIVTSSPEIMSNLTKLEFVALDISGKNYLSWILDAEIHLEAMNLGDATKDGNQASPQNRAKAMIFMRKSNDFYSPSSP
jgi:hypothetical protein